MLTNGAGAYERTHVCRLKCNGNAVSPLTSHSIWNTHNQTRIHNSNIRYTLRTTHKQQQQKKKEAAQKIYATKSKTDRNVCSGSSMHSHALTQCLNKNKTKRNRQNPWSVFEHCFFIYLFFFLSFLIILLSSCCRRR